MVDRALLIIDVQNDFCEGGSLAVEGGNEVVRRINALLASQPGYARVIATRDHHVDPGHHFDAEPDFIDSWPAHCVAGTRGAELHPELNTSHLDAVFDKGEFAAAYSGFQGAADDGTSLTNWLRERNVTAVDVVGLATDYCVKETALDASRNGFDTRVLLDLTAGVGGVTTSGAIDEMRSVGIELVGVPARP